MQRQIQQAISTNTVEDSAANAPDGIAIHCVVDEKHSGSVAVAVAKPATGEAVEYFGSQT